MILGCAGVGALYLLVNWVFVANLTPQSATAVFNYDTEQVTLGHVVLKNIVGEAGGTVMSGIIFLLLASAISAMTFIGPRVYAAMAEDGFLPQALRGEQGRPPTTSSILQAVLALGLIYTHKLEEVLSDVGALLTLFAALTVAALFVSRWTRPELPRPQPWALVAAGLYVVSSILMLYYGLQKASDLLWWVGGVGLVALGAYALTRKRLAVVGAGNGQDPH
jgi:APA family basic amino acid/polyamine antiporter